MTSQETYDAFNSFIFSSDSNIFGKLLARLAIALETQHVPGDIVECGVYKGSGIFTWLKLKRALFSNARKKVIGFDYFDTEALINSLFGLDKQEMEKLFKDRNWAHVGEPERKLACQLYDAGFTNDDFELVKGDISKTAPAYVQNKPGFRISILYMDLDLADCTYNALAALWPHVSKGGMIVFDEYGYSEWSESDGVDRFFRDKDVEIKMLNCQCPTAYVIK